MSTRDRDSALSGESRRANYLAAYDTQLRVAPEMAHALHTGEDGPLHFAVFAGGHGFVTYPGLSNEDAADLRPLIMAARDYFDRVPGIASVEWKTRGHDDVPGLHDALTEHGFVAGEAESIMIGEAALLAREVVIPAEVEVRRALTDDDVLAAEEMQGAVFGDPEWRSRAEITIRRLTEDDTVEVWIALVDASVISAGRLEPVAGTEFAGLWGGATMPEWRGQGIYRALTAERARSALRRGKRYLQSDSTEFSRPILERAGLVKVSTTTPYVWTPGLA